MSHKCNFKVYKLSPEYKMMLFGSKIILNILEESLKCVLLEMWISNGNYAFAFEHRCEKYDKNFTTNLKNKTA